MAETLVAFDYSIFHFFNSFAGQSPVFDFLFIALADFVIFLMVAGLALFVLLRKKDRVRLKIALQALLAAFIGRALIVTFIRALFFRPRPFLIAIVHQLIAQNPYEGSFPSGHATIMFAIGFTLLYINRRWGGIYLAFAFVSSLARIVVGVHFPLDIIGGILVAALATIVAQKLFDFYLYYRGARRSL